MNVKVTTIYRRAKDSTSGQTFQSRIQAYDPNYQQLQVSPGFGALYYSAAWPDWGDNPLLQNRKRVLKPAIGTTLTFSENPIYSDENDIFVPLFTREPVKQATKLWKFGPITFENGLKFVV